MENSKIIKQRENPLFNRKEIEISVETNIAPKMKEAEEFVAKEFSSNADNIKIRKIKGRFGSNTFIITANVYHTKEDKEKSHKASKKEKAENKTEEKKE
jgi:ribosomal protein S24E